MKTSLGMIAVIGLIAGTGAALAQSIPGSPPYQRPPPDQQPNGWSEHLGIRPNPLILPGPANPTILPTRQPSSSSNLTGSYQQPSSPALPDITIRSGGPTGSSGKKMCPDSSHPGRMVPC